MTNQPNQLNSRCPHCAGRLFRQHDVRRCAALMAARAAFVGLRARAVCVRGVGRAGDWLTGVPLVD